MSSGDRRVRESGSGTDSGVKGITLTRNKSIVIIVLAAAV